MMRFRKGLFLTVILLAGMSLTFMPSTASATMYEMKAANVDLGLAPGTVFATVDLTVSGTTASFQVDVNTGILSGGVIDKFFFNTDLSLSSTDFTLPTDWTTKSPSQGDGFGNFSWQVKGNKNPLTSLSFSITNSLITGENNFALFSDSGTGPALFAAHIRNFDINGETSAHFAVVPEPSTLLLLGSGLTALGLWRRRRFKS